MINVTLLLTNSCLWPIGNPFTGQINYRLVNNVAFQSVQIACHLLCVYIFFCLLFNISSHFTFTVYTAAHPAGILVCAMLPHSPTLWFALLVYFKANPRSLWEYRHLAKTSLFNKRFQISLYGVIEPKTIEWKSE